MIHAKNYRLVIVQTRCNSYLWRYALLL